MNNALPQLPPRHCKDHSCSCILDKYLFPAEQFPRFRRCTQIWNDITLPSPPAFCAFNCYASEDNFPLSRQGGYYNFEQALSLTQIPLQSLIIWELKGHCLYSWQFGQPGEVKEAKKSYHALAWPRRGEHLQQVMSPLPFTHSLGHWVQIA